MSLPRKKNVFDHPCERLKALRQRAGYSPAEMQRLLKFNSPSAYTRYERFDKRAGAAIPRGLIKQLIPLFENRGLPPITADEIIQLELTAEDIKQKTGVQVVSGIKNSGYTPPSLAFTTPNKSKDNSLPVRVRAERGAFVTEDFGDREYEEDTQLVPSSSYPVEAQFCVMVMDDHAEPFGYPSRTQLHCCFPAEFDPPGPVGKKVVMWMQRDRTGLGEMVVMKFKKKANDNAEWLCVDAAGKDARGKPIGVVVGSLRRE